MEPEQINARIAKLSANFAQQVSNLMVEKSFLEVAVQELNAEVESLKEQLTKEEV